MLSLLIIADRNESLARSLAPSQTEIRAAPDLPSATRLLAGGTGSPGLILLVESHPGQHSPAALALLQRAAPLARVWRVLGSWCEGEARSGRPPAGCLAAYDHQIVPRLSRAIRRFAAGKPVEWMLPLTATPEERLLATIDDLDRRAEGIVAIHAQSAAATSALVDLCRAAGYTPLVWPDAARPLPADQQVAAVVWDTAARELGDARRIGRLQTAGAPLIALAGFPRPEDIAAARTAGVAAVISKPYLAADLLDELARVTAAA